MVFRQYISERSEPTVGNLGSHSNRLILAVLLEELIGKKRPSVSFNIFP